MEKIKININNFTAQDIKTIALYLKGGKTIIYPTDTVYGIGCDAGNIEAIKKIYRIKKRDIKKPLLVLIAEWKMLHKYFIVKKDQQRYLKEIWPGPVTAVLKRRENLPSILSAGRNTLAARMPKNDFLAELIRKAGRPIVSSSLNISGRRAINDLKKADAYFGRIKPDLAIDAGKLKRKKPSKIIDLTDINNIKTLRK